MEEKVVEIEGKELSAVSPYQIMDRLDDEAIVAELEGRVTEAWVYHFVDKDGRDIWGLSKVGVDAAGREMAKQGEALREIGLKWEIDPSDSRFALFTGMVQRVVATQEKEIGLDQAIGTKRQCLFIQKKDEGVTTQLNPFWFEQGATKALRNARARLISEEMRASIMATAKQLGRVKAITAKGASPQKAESKPTQQSAPAQGSKRTTVEIWRATLKEANAILAAHTPPTPAFSSVAEMVSMLRKIEGRVVEAGQFEDQSFATKAIARLTEKKREDHEASSGSDMGRKGWP